MAAAEFNSALIDILMPLFIPKGNNPLATYTHTQICISLEITQKICRVWFLNVFINKQIFTTYQYHLRSFPILHILQAKTSRWYTSKYIIYVFFEYLFNIGHYDSHNLVVNSQKMFIKLWKSLDYIYIISAHVFFSTFAKIIQVNCTISHAQVWVFHIPDW